MHGIMGLAQILREGRKNNGTEEQRAQRGRIQNGRVHIGEQSYPFRAAMDWNTSDGSLVWIQISKGGTAIIVGA